MKLLRLLVLASVTCFAQTSLITVNPPKAANVVIAPASALTCTLTQHSPSADVQCTADGVTFTLPLVPITAPTGFAMSFTSTAGSLNFTLTASAAGPSGTTVAWTASATAPGSTTPQTGTGYF